MKSNQSNNQPIYTPPPGFQTSTNPFGEPMATDSLHFHNQQTQNTSGQNTSGHPTSPTMSPNSSQINLSFSQINTTTNRSNYAPPPTGFGASPTGSTATYQPPPNTDPMSIGFGLHSNQEGNPTGEMPISLKMRLQYFGIGAGIGTGLGALLALANIMIENLPATSSLPQIIEFAGFFGLMLGIIFAIRPDRVKEAYQKFASKIPAE